MVTTRQFFEETAINLLPEEDLNLLNRFHLEAQVPGELRRSVRLGQAHCVPERSGTGEGGRLRELGQMERLRPRSGQQRATKRSVRFYHGLHRTPQSADQGEL